VKIFLRDATVEVRLGRNNQLQQFKTLAKKRLLSNVVIGEKTIHREIKPEGAKEVLPADRLKSSQPDDQKAKTALCLSSRRNAPEELARLLLEKKLSSDRRCKVF